MAFSFETLRPSSETARLGGFRLGRLLGFPIEVRYSFLLLLLLAFVVYGGLAGVGLLLVTFVSVLLHELGHAVIARRRGVSIVNIELHFFGGAARMASMPRTPRDEVLIAAAGPVVSFALAALGGVGFALTSVKALAFFGMVNLVLGVFNLLPALPMDGGRILRAALTKRMGRVRATELAVKIARGLALVMGAWALLSGQLFLVALAVMLWMMAGAELQATRFWSYAGRDGYQPGRDSHGERGGVEVLDRDGRPVVAHAPDSPSWPQATHRPLQLSVVEERGPDGERRWVMRGPDGLVILASSRPLYF